MRPSVPLFLLLLAGFLISVALTPSIPSKLASLDGPPEAALPPPPVPPADLYLLESEPDPLEANKSSPPPPSLASAATSLVPSNSQINDRKLGLYVYPNGSIYALDTDFWVKLWEYHTGFPSSHFEETRSHANKNGYCMYPAEDGSVYEYSKAFGIRKLDATIDELVHRTPFVKGSALTLGSKKSTMIHLDYSTGELLHEDHFGCPLPVVGVSDVEEKPELFESAYCRDVLTIIRIDYSLNSTVLGKYVWGMSDSSFIAYVSKYGCQLPSNTGGGLALPHSQRSIDVYRVPNKFIKPRGASRGTLMLPSGNSTMGLEALDTLSRSEEFAAVSRSNVSKIYPHLTSENHQNWNRSSDKLVSLSAQQNSSDATANSLLEIFGAYRVKQELSWDKLSGNLSDAETPMFNQTSGSGPYGLCRDANNCLMVHGAELKMLPQDSMVKVPKQVMLSKAMYGISVVFLVSLLISSAFFFYLKFRVVSTPHKQLIDLRMRESVASKKKKTRKSGNVKDHAIRSNHDGQNSFQKQISIANGHVNGQSYETRSFVNLLGADIGDDGRWIGKLFVTNSEIGKGSNGTVVFEGVYDGRPVAVKRLLRAHNDVAHKEIKNLIVSDHHPNIVRLFGVEGDSDFVYIALERCICSLSDLIQLCSDPPIHPTITESSISHFLAERRVPKHSLKGFSEDLELWTADGFPSPQLVKLMRDVVSGLAHLHKLGIIHRDLKPQNVLISGDRILNAKLSDMGISKRLIEDMSSLSHHATGHGSSGWQAPEQLLHGRQTRAVDLFSLGCILFFCFTKGKHPFGSYYERDSNILNNRVDLFLVDHIPEAVHLFSQLLDANPDMRPNVGEVLHHPLFWSPEMRLAFLRDTSDRVELEDREGESELLRELESIAPVAFGGKWGEKLDAAFIMDMGRYRKYNFDCTRDLLRVIRNKLNHFRELPKDLQEVLGSLPLGFDSYFTKRFPKLLIEVYKVISRYCREEDCFRSYFKSTLV